MERTHYLKTWPVYYGRCVSGQKPFEVRKNDRDFQTGDILVLQEYDPEEDVFTGQETHFEVTYVLHGGQFGVEPGFCVMGISNPA